MKVSKTEFGADDVLKVSVNVTNTGDVPGKESVLLFSSDFYASSTPDVRRLRAFDKIELAPGETRTVELEVSAKDLAFADYYGKWTLEEGEFALSAGDQEVVVNCVETKVWEEPVID